VEKSMSPVRRLEVVREETSPVVVTKEEPIRLENPMEGATREEVTFKVDPTTKLSTLRVL
jgi:hypothetical protein